MEVRKPPTCPQDETRCSRGAKTLARHVALVPDRWSAILAMLGSACLLAPSLAVTMATTLVGEGNAMFQVIALCMQQLLWGSLASGHLFCNLRLSRYALGWPPWPGSDDVCLGALAGVTLAGVGAVATWLGRQAVAIFVGPGRALAIYYREQAPLSGLLRYESSAWTLLLLLGTVVIVVPVCEELFFRGYLYAALKAHLGGHALWVNSVIFAALHFYVVHGLSVFLMALGLTVLYERRGSLWTSIVAHATVNTVVASLVLFQRFLVKG